MLNIHQIEAYKSQGYFVAENVIDSATIHSIRQEIDRWSEQSRNFSVNYGKLLNGEPRFDLEPGHNPLSPRLRRISSPQEVSDDIKNCVMAGTIPQHLVALLGPDIKFDHCKINSKFPGMSTDVKYHQDHIFEPQTNDSMLSMLIMLDDTTTENGCLKIVPGSHKMRYSHSKGNYFTGRLDDSLTREMDQLAVNIEAPAGSICFMNTWAVHGSESNKSTNPRRVLIAEYKAADAFPLTTHKIPSRYMDTVIMGQNALKPRYRDVLDFEVPMDYEGDSLFDLQDIVDSKSKYAENVSTAAAS